MIRKLLLAIGTVFFLTQSTQAQSIQKYFGYWSADQPQPVTDLSEIKDHINLYSIAFWSGNTTNSGRQGSEDYLMAQLAQAKKARVKVIIPGYPFLFQGTSDETCWQNEPNAVSIWEALIQRMIDGGFIVPGSPDKSTVAAIYLVDEPNRNCLADQNNAPNLALQNAISAIKNNPSTANIPVATILAVKFDDFRLGMQLFDWIGFDAYGDPLWSQYLSQLESYVPNKKIILVPGGQSGPGCVAQDAPDVFIQRMNSDQRTIWLAPFTWTAQGGCAGVGVRDIPSLRAAYTTYGKAIKAQGCASSSDEKKFCNPPATITSIINFIFNDTP